jgi:alkanesulfonate monooxygenase SsuD/methylene tetrahydromethanopterin reductase-like flavin-dependent oxidoreductase (luciferase family)
MTEVELTVGLPPTSKVPELFQYAESLGYTQGYVFDTAFQGDDIWYQLHRAAQATTTLRLGPGVLIPTQRHPLVNAAQTISLHKLAPGRVTTSFGTGFSSRAAIGQPPIKWSYMEEYITAYQQLLAGEIAQWEGAPIKMLLNGSQWENDLPLHIPLIMSGMGPKGDAVSRRLGAEGMISLFQVTPQQAAYDKRVVVVMGTVLDDGEKVGDDRVRDTAGVVAGVQLHFAWTLQGPDAVLEMPGGKEWLDVINQSPEHERYLSVHQGHLLKMSDADTAAWNAGSHALLPENTLTGSTQEVSAAIRKLIDDGATEIQIQPSGPDIPRELERFMTAARHA